MQAGIKRRLCVSLSYELQDVKLKCFATDHKGAEKPSVCKVYPILHHQFVKEREEVCETDRSLIILN